MPMSVSLTNACFLSGINFGKRKDLFDQAKKGEIATRDNINGYTAAI